MIAAAPIEKGKFAVPTVLATVRNNPHIVLKHALITAGLGMFVFVVIGSALGIFRLLEERMKVLPIGFR